MDWLRASERAYPVYVDPTFQVGPSYQKSHKSDGAVYIDQSHIGNTRQGNANVYWRTYSWYNSAPSYKKFVANAQIALAYAGSGTTSTYWAEVYRGTGDCFTCRSTHLSSVSLGSGTAWTTGNKVAKLVVDYHAMNKSGIPYLLQGWEASDYSYKKIASAFYMEYWDFPTVSQVSPANGVTGQSLTPTLSVSSTKSSPSAANQLHSFEISPNANMSSPVWTSGWIAPKQATVPEGKLQPGQTYYWRGKTIDGYNGHLGQSTERVTGVRSLKTQLVPPTPPEETATPGNASGLPQTIVTLTPTLVVDAVADPDNVPAGAEVKYEFKIATGADGKSGQCSPPV